MPDISRRQFIGVVGASAAIATASVAGIATSLPDNETDSRVEFHGSHQAGIVTPAQDRLHFVAFDVTTSDRNRLVQLLRDWTTAARSLTQGQEIGVGGATNGPSGAAPSDSGEALGLPATNLTLTIGFGPTLFNHPDLGDRFGIANRRPGALIDLPAFPGDALDPLQSNGDIAIQACADDPQVAVHAIRNLVRIARGVAVVRYSQLGFGRTSTTSTKQSTPRNLMGFKDGTANLKLEDAASLDEQVWANPSDGALWMIGGSYLVTRRIRMLIEPWDTTPLAEQERVIGRTKGEGAPVGSLHEFDTLNLNARDTSGELLIDDKAHVRLAHPTVNGGAQLLRRGYSFVDGTDGLGRLDAGLFFMAYQRDPRKQFIVINRNLAGKHNDSLNEYIQHVSSGIFACPPGVDKNGFWGQTLFS